MRDLYHTRAAILRQELVFTDGDAQQAWTKISQIVDPYLNEPGEMMCRIDLSYVRVGKDQPTALVAGRVPDRQGLLFLDPTDELRMGDHIECLDGPISGIFEMRAKPDPIAGYALAHHMEVQIIEVAQTMNSNLLNRTAVAGSE